MSVPNYMTPCRVQTLQVELALIASGEPLHLVVDSKGRKVYGESVWKVHQHGYSKRRAWGKVHLALDTKTGHLRAALMTRQDVADGNVLAELLDQMPTDERLDSVDGDGAYDSKSRHAAIAARGAMPSIPPREGAAH
ncbi:transposase [Burkholderia ubonensis]|nr:transposase [Burkholderia ubonensis]